MSANKKCSPFDFLSFHYKLILHRLPSLQATTKMNIFLSGFWHFHLKHFSSNDFPTHRKVTPQMYVGDINLNGTIANYSSVVSASFLLGIKEHVKNIGPRFPRYRDRIISSYNIWIIHRDNKDRLQKNITNIRERNCPLDLTYDG